MDSIAIPRTTSQLFSWKLNMVADSTIQDHDDIVNFMGGGPRHGVLITSTLHGFMQWLRHH